MHKDYLQDALIVDRYLRDDLTDEEAERFEEHFLSNPDVLDEIALTEKLRQGLEDVTVIESVQKAESEPARKWSSFRTTRYAAAATVLLLISVSITSLLYEPLNLPEAVYSVPEPGAVRLVPLMNVRSSGAATAVNRIETGFDEQIVLLVDPGPGDYASYRVTLVPAGAGTGTDPVWQLEGVTPGYQDMLALAMPSTRLGSGAYLLRVEGWREEWPASRDYEPVSETGLEVELTH